MFSEEALEAKRVLEGAYELLATPERWTYGAEAMARDAGGDPCDPASDEATSWCAGGAVERAAVEMGVWEGPALEWYRATNGMPLHLANERGGYESVMRGMLRTLRRISALGATV
jgi:hypothetical protein